MKDVSFVESGGNSGKSFPDNSTKFGIELMQNRAARNAYGILSEKEKTQLIRYIQESKTGSDAEIRMENAVDMLESGTYRVFSCE